MSKSKLFNCEELAQYYKEGHLDDLLKRFDKEINSRTLIGAGNDASAFRYGTDQVLKLTTKNIKWFKHFGNGASDAKEFQKHINSLKPYFAPIDKILYEDDRVFIYVQRKCQVIDKSHISSSEAIGMFKFVKFMIENDVLMTDLAPHNLGTINGQLVSFDFHGLGPLSNGDGKFRKSGWWRRLARNLARFMAAVYVPKDMKKYGEMFQNCTTKTIQKIKQDSNLPKSFGNLVEYMSDNLDNAEVDTVVKLLAYCISDMTKFASSKAERSRH